VVPPEDGVVPPDPAGVAAAGIAGGAAGDSPPRAKSQSHFATPVEPGGAIGPRAPSNGVPLEPVTRMLVGLAVAMSGNAHC
jgi:hypothetical protein